MTWTPAATAARRGRPARRPARPPARQRCRHDQPRREANGAARRRRPRRPPPRRPRRAGARRRRPGARRGARDRRRRSGGCTQHLATQLPFTFRITVADNASTDATYDIAAPARRRPRPGPRRAAAAEGARPRAARGLVAVRRRRARLHGRRPLDRPARPAAAGRAAGRRALRHRHRHPAGARLPGGPRPEARADLARLQPAAARHPRRAVQRRAVRLQGDPRATSPSSCCRWSRTPAGSSTPSCWSSPSAAGCGSTRCRSTGSTTRTAGSTSSRPPSPTCAASRGSAARWPPGRCPCRPYAPSSVAAPLAPPPGVPADAHPAAGALRRHRRREHAGLPRALPAACAPALGAQPAEPGRAARSRRSPTPPPTVGSPSALRGARLGYATRRRGSSCSASASRSPAARSPRCTPGGRTRAGPSRSRPSWWPTPAATLVRFLMLRRWVFRRGADR